MASRTSVPVEVALNRILATRAVGAVRQAELSRALYSAVDSVVLSVGAGAIFSVCGWSSIWLLPLLGPPALELSHIDPKHTPIPSKT